MREKFFIFVFMLILSPMALLSIEAFRVTSATVEVSEREFAGTCPHRFIFTGRIAVNRAGTVRYRWTRSDGAAVPEQTLVFGAAGTQTVSDYWELGGGGMGSFPDRWMAIEIASPNTLTSNRATFSLRCIPRVMAPSYEISGAIESGPQGNLVAGRQVRVSARQSGADPRSQMVTLDANGRGTYFFGRIGNGVYTISVEKVAYTGPAGLNVCFRGTDPPNRRVELSGGSPRATDQNFTVLYVVGWDRGPCW